LPGGTPFAEPGLWALAFGGGGLGGDPRQLYFSAGINFFQDGLFGALRPTPEPGAAILLGVGAILLGAYQARRALHRRRAAA
jgi:hypothetical protein